MDLISDLKILVRDHRVLKHPWLLKRSETMTKEDLLLWLGQEYFVSVAFVNWFLLSASLTSSIPAKIILVQNIWEELGEGNEKESHVQILQSFLRDLNYDPNSHRILSGTKAYLEKMQELVTQSFCESLGALGPANEYLLKLEYSQMYQSFQKLKLHLKSLFHPLPEGKFFQVNLNADEGHAQKMFELISLVAKTTEEQKSVFRGCEEALDARWLFYEGLMEVEKK